MGATAAAATILGVSIGALGAEDAAPADDLVPVHGFAVQPFGNFSAAEGRFIVHPKALLGLGYDSNVYATDTAQRADIYVRGMAGVFARYLPNPDLSWAFDGELERQQFRRETGRDATIGRASLNCIGTGPVYRWDAAAGFVRLDDPLFDSGERALHDEFTLHCGLSERDAVRHRSATLDFQRQDYLQDTRFFTRNENDRNLVTLGLHAGWLPFPEEEWYVGGGLGYSRYDADRFNDSERITLFVGWIKPLGARTQADVALGASWWHFSDDFAGDASYGDREVVAPYADASLRWAWEDGSDVHATAFSHLLDSLTSNAAWAVGAEVGGRLRLLARCSSFAALRVFEARGSGAAAGQTIEVRTNEEASLGLDYALREGVALRLTGGYLHSHSRTGISYDRLSATVDIAVVY